MASLLENIVENKKKDIDKLYYEIDFKKLDEIDSNKISFYDAISKEWVYSSPNIIAEIKRASPSGGNINADAKPEEIAKRYKEAGACAISVLTDELYFKGNVEHLQRVRKTVDLALLGKDFIIDIYQIFQSRCCGADAILLISEIKMLDVSKMKKLIGIADSLDMDCVVEFHTRDGLEKAKDAGARIFGINNRDLNDLNLSVDLNTTKRLLPYIPDGYPIISMSGIKTHDDVMKVMDPRINAILTSAPMKSSDKIYELQGR